MNDENDPLDVGFEPNNEFLKFLQSEADTDSDKANVPSLKNKMENETQKT